MEAGEAMSKKLFPEERRLHILEEVRRAPLVKAEDLADHFGVSVETVRRDLLELQHRGLLRRVYGGAVQAAPRSSEPPFERRRTLYLDRKRAMGRLAASLVSPGDTLLLDVGTSVAEVARQLPRDYHGKVLTNSLLVGIELSHRSSVEVLVSGGNLRGGDLACSGHHAQVFFDEFYADIAFLGSGGVHHEAGLTDFYPDEVVVRRRIIDRAAKAFVLADSSKVGQVALQRVCDLTDVTGVITDEEVEPERAEELRSAGVEVIIAPMEEIEQRVG